MSNKISNSPPVDIHSLPRRLGFSETISFTRADLQGIINDPHASVQKKRVAVYLLNNFKDTNNDGHMTMKKNDVSAKLFGFAKKLGFGAPEPAADKHVSSEVQHQMYTMDSYHSPLLFQSPDSLPYKLGQQSHELLVKGMNSLLGTKAAKNLAETGGVEGKVVHYALKKIFKEDMRQRAKEKQTLNPDTTPNKSNKHNISGKKNTST